MIKPILSILLAASLSMFSFKFTKGSHLLGGELNWECVSSGSDYGKFIFHLTVYKMCGSQVAGLSNTQFIYGPNDDTIIVILDTITELNRPCWDTNQIVVCNNQSIGTHIIQKYDYRSVPIQLTGVPDTSGWEFHWNSCCRTNASFYSPLIDNLGFSNQSMSIQAKMYPFSPTGGSNALDIQTCYDSSPKFSQDPTPFYCTGAPVLMNHSAYDVDGDSLSYNWSPAVDDTGGVVIYANHTNTSQSVPRNWGGGYIVPAPGFSYTVPMPWSHPNMDTNNVPASIDSSTGIISFTSFTLGRYVVCSKVSAYRNGQKIAEIFREISVTVKACTSGTNMLPLLTLTDTNSTNVAANQDTIYLGDNFSIDIHSADLDSNLSIPPVLQYNELSIYGSQIGSNIFKDTNCQIAPCAYIDSTKSTMDSNVVRAQGGILGRFNWQTNCQHMQNAIMLSNGHHVSTYSFIIEVADDYCPFPGTKQSLLEITILDTTSIAPSLDSIVNTNGNIELYWTNLQGPYPGYYVVADTTNQLGAFLVDSLTSLDSSFIDSGKGGNDTHYLYRLEKITNAACVQQTWVESTELEANHNGQRNVELNWSPHINKKGLHMMYYVFSSTDKSSWILEDSVEFGFDSLILVNVVCNQMIYYKVEAVYGNGFKSISNIDSIHITAPKPTISIQNNLLTSSIGLSYTWYFNNQLIVGVNSRIISTVGNGYYQVEILDTNSCLVISDSVSTINLMASHQSAAHIQLTWNDFDSENAPEGAQYNIDWFKFSGVWQTIVTVPFGTSFYEDSLRECDSAQFYRIRAIYPSGSIVHSNLDSSKIPSITPEISANGNKLTSTNAVDYQWFKNGNLTIIGATSREYEVTSNGSYTVFTTDTNTCKLTSEPYDFQWLNQNKHTYLLDQISIVPNPTNGVFELFNKETFLEGDVVQIRNANGRLVHKRIIQNENSNISISLVDIPAGMYTVLIIRESKIVFTDKMVLVN